MSIAHVKHTLNDNFHTVTLEEFHPRNSTLFYNWEKLFFTKEVTEKIGSRICRIMLDSNGKVTRENKAKTTYYFKEDGSCLKTKVTH